MLEFWRALPFEKCCYPFNDAVEAGQVRNVTDVMIFFFSGVAVVLLLLLVRKYFGSFQGQRTDDYEDGSPVFEFRKHLNGKMICEGTIFGPSGRMSSTFVAYFDIKWRENRAVMSERFVYGDSTEQNREWTITLGQNGRFEATAPDVVGVAKGRAAGPAVLIRYLIRLPDDLGGHVLRAFDCMYLTPSGTIVNRSQFRKFGFLAAELVSTIRPVDSNELLTR